MACRSPTNSIRWQDKSVQRNVICRSPHYSVFSALTRQNPLSAGATTISGDLLTVSFPASLAPSLGLTPSNYTWNVWPRTGAGNDNQISDFAQISQTKKRHTTHCFHSALRCQLGLVKVNAE